MPQAQFFKNMRFGHTFDHLGHEEGTPMHNMAIGGHLSHRPIGRVINNGLRQLRNFVHMPSERQATIQIRDRRYPWNC